MKRLAIALFAILIAAAAPARAWCEASCLASAHTESTTPHCPAHESPSDGTQISPADTTNCPTLDAARPVPATLAVSQPAVSVAAAGTAAPQALRHLRHPSTQAPRHPLAVPLRI